MFRQVFGNFNHTLKPKDCFKAQFLHFSAVCVSYFSLEKCSYDSVLWWNRPTFFSRSKQYSKNNVINFFTSFSFFLLLLFDILPLSFIFCLVYILWSSFSLNSLFVVCYEELLFWLIWLSKSGLYLVHMNRCMFFFFFSI